MDKKESNTHHRSSSVVRTLDDLDARLREVLGEISVPVREVARRTGISKTQLSNFKNGERNLSFQNLHILANDLGVRYNLKNY